MGEVQGLRDRRHYLDYLFEGHPRRVALLEQVAGVGAVDEVHRDPQAAVELAPVVHTHEVWMPQSRCQLSLADEPCPEFLIVGGVGGQDLECIQTGQAGMLDEINLTHPTGAEEPLNGVTGENVTVVERHDQKPTKREEG